MSVISDCGKSSNVCQICPKARLHRTPFPKNNSVASDLFEVILVDIWGLSLIHI